MNGVIVITATEGYLDAVHVFDTSERALGFASGFAMGAGAYGGGAEVFIEDDPDHTLTEHLESTLPDQKRLGAEVQAAFAQKRAELDGGS